MLFTDSIQTLEINVTEREALEIRERELARGALKVNIHRVHSALIRIEIISRPIIDVTPHQRRLH